VPAVEFLRVPLVPDPDDPRQGVLAPGHREQMHVVRHQAVRSHAAVRPRQMVDQQRLVQRTVAVVRENIRATISAMRHVVRDAGQDQSGNPSHAGRSGSKRRRGKKMVPNVPALGCFAIEGERAAP